MPAFQGMGRCEDGQEIGVVREGECRGSSMIKM